MANKISTAELERGIGELSNVLSGSEWRDEVKDSYFCFIEEEKRLISNMTWIADKASSIYNNACSVDVGKFQSSYRECMAKLMSLQRGN